MIYSLARCLHYTVNRGASPNATRAAPRAHDAGPVGLIESKIKERQVRESAVATGLTSTQARATEGTGDWVV